MDFPFRIALKSFDSHDSRLRPAQVDEKAGIQGRAEDGAHGQSGKKLGSKLLPRFQANSELQCGRNDVKTHGNQRDSRILKEIQGL